MPSAGDPIRAADLTTISQSANLKPLVRLIQTVAQSIPNNSSLALTFAAGSEDIDTNGWHDTVTNNTRITPTIAGYYRLSAAYHSVAHAGTCDIAFTKTGGVAVPSGQREGTTAASGLRGILANAIQSANGTTDYFEVQANQVSGGALNTGVSARLTSFFECEFLRPL
jgi:hypothetical protein